MQEEVSKIGVWGMGIKDYYNRSLLILSFLNRFSILEILGISHTTLLVTFKTNKSTSKLMRRVAGTHV
ncbi:hypothetical protein ES319_D05G385600v1 [Gossypium barbadense]|uniref:Uncharacterized protein n=1 Tax=Gossypium barbadense TaxID=3634 RepID=A0A5J5RMJ9_GOSBA|nr:hypothetical protein ES319_D05G385600v1 [Gossypium barbadense]